jgi:hypothetical protein
MSKAHLLTIRDLVLGACLGAALFGTGYLLGATYPPQPASIDVDFGTSAPIQRVGEPIAI